MEFRDSDEKKRYLDTFSKVWHLAGVGLVIAVVVLGFTFGDHIDLRWIVIPAWLLLMGLLVRFYYLRWSRDK